MLKDAFDAFDSNKDGKIDSADLKTYWRNKGEDSSDRRIADFIREKDINNDGVLSFEEFAVSYSALLQPETDAWSSVEKGGGKGAKGPASRSNSGKGKASGTLRPSAASGEIDPADVDDGATGIAAAFGALRLCATIPQCLSAVTTASTIISKILDAPATKMYWRVKAGDEHFHETVENIMVASH
jgi:hypothetical protein